MGQLTTFRKKEEPIGGCLHSPVYETGPEVKYKAKKNKPKGGSMSSSSV